MKKKAVIFGLTGQDGFFLSRLLLSKNYEVHAVVRQFPEKTSDGIEYISSYQNLEDPSSQIVIHFGDLLDTSSIMQVLVKVLPDEVYNLAGISKVQLSSVLPEQTMNTVAGSVLRLLEFIKNLGLTEKVRFFQACSSEIFGNASESPQTELTPVNPVSPYAIAKAYSYFLVKYYREAYGMFAVNGILFNHESERRGKDFVTKKIVSSAVKIASGKQDVLYLGNLNAKRDWGYAKDYVECMWLMLQQQLPEDFVVATGIQYSVRDFCTLAFKCVGIDLEWIGERGDEVGIDKTSQKILVKIDPHLFHNVEISSTVGNPRKAMEKLGWDPHRTSFEQLVKIMVSSEQ